MLIFAKTYAMKTSIFFTFFLAVTFFSCTKRQYVYLNSVPDSGQDNLTYVNDSLEIEYDFSGNNCPVNVTIYNKSNQPVYVDWKKSVAIIDDMKVDYYNNTKSFTGETWIGDVYGSFDGQIYSDERITFIPPATKYRTTRAHLCEYFEDLPRPKKLRVPADSGTTIIKFYQFIPEVSPLSFKSLITLSTNESFLEEVRFENEFYISEIVESTDRTYKLNTLSMSNANTLYAAGSKSEVSKLTGFTYFFAWGIVLPSVIVLSAVYGDEE